MRNRQEKTLLRRFITAMSLSPEDIHRELRTPQGQLQVYPRNEDLHVAQLTRMRGQKL